MNPRQPAPLTPWCEHEIRSQRHWSGTNLRLAAAHGWKSDGLDLRMRIVQDRELAQIFRLGLGDASSLEEDGFVKYVEAELLPASQGSGPYWAQTPVPRGKEAESS